MPANAIFPRQDILETQKTPKWYGENLDYAEHLLQNSRSMVQEMNLCYDSYVGKTEAESIKYLISTYGMKNRGKYVPYRLSKTKLDVLVGEWLQMPLNSTVKTVNSEAVTAKMQKYELMLGAMNAKPEIDKLKSVGVDVMEGMEVPDKNDPSAWEKMSFKDKNESIMQIMLKEMIPELGIQEKGSSNVQDCTIASRCYSRLEVNEVSGEMEFRPIDPRDRICIEFERDPFLEKSFIMGAVQKVPINKILTTYRLTEVQRNKLDMIRQSPQNYVSDAQYRGRYSYQNGEFCADVIHIEWKGVRPKYSKITPKTKAQMEFDGEVDSYNTVMSPKDYEENKDSYNKDISKGKIKEIVTEWEEDMYTATRIGHDIDIECKRKPFIMRDEDTGKILGFSYVGLVFNKVDGAAVSLKQICEPFDNVFDILMFQILKEINKAKGKVIVYDRAGLPKKTKVKNVLYNALNDSFIDYDSSAAGNMSGKDLSINNIFKEIDLGVSNSFPYLLQMKNEIVGMLDLITGITGARQGQIKASATVANSMQNLESSRTITEPMFYYLTKYFERVLMNVVETGKLVWGLYQPNKARMVLGDEKYKFLQITKDIAFASYRTELVNPRWEQAIKDRMRNYLEFSLNSKELRAQDGLDFEMAETLADANAKLRKAWDDISKMRQESTDKQMQMQSQTADKQMQTQIQLNREQREDVQTDEKDNIILKAKMDMQRDDNKNKGKLIVDQNSYDQEDQMQE